MNLLVFIAQFFIVFIYAILFLTGGRFLISIIYKNKLPVSFINGSGFFLGIGVFLTVTRTISYFIGNLKYSIISSTVFIMILGSPVIFNYIKQKDNKLAWFGGPSIHKVFFNLISLALLYLLILLFWLYPVDGTFDVVYNMTVQRSDARSGNKPGEVTLTPIRENILDSKFTGVNSRLFYNMGSLHSGRSALLAEWMFQNNHIPILNQNYGHSVLSSITLFFGLAEYGVMMFLNIWLYFSMIAFGVLSYGIFRIFIPSTLYAKIAAFLFMTGNTALSFANILVVDTGNPWIMNGYPDSLIGLGSFLSLLVIFMFLSEAGQGNRNLVLHGVAGVVFLLFGFTSNLLAAQNIVLMLGLFSVFSVYKIFVKSKIKSLHAMAAIFFLIGSVCGAWMGGMLTPKKLQDSYNIPSMRGLSNLKGPVLKLSVYLPFNYPYPKNYFGWLPGLLPPYAEPFPDEFILQADKNSSLAIQYIMKEKNVQAFQEILWSRMEMMIWTAITTAFRVAFFPILGFVFLGSLLYSLGKKQIQSHPLLPQLTQMHLFWTMGLLVFVFAFTLNFLFEYHGLKWELTRFLAPGYAMGMIFFILWFHFMVEKFQYNRLYWTILAFIMSVGPLLRMIDIVHANVFSVNTFDNLAYRISLLLSHQFIKM
ncbi:MAG: hypothetical protein HQL65_03360 [Magnetococcales bacterium]|nr:hypothetical protein [Magnetococcales bacterium]